jgi:hypothetical protein
MCSREIDTFPTSDPVSIIQSVPPADDFGNADPLDRIRDGLVLGSTHMFKDGVIVRMDGSGGGSAGCSLLPD